VCSHCREDFLISHVYLLLHSLQFWPVAVSMLQIRSLFGGRSGFLSRAGLYFVRACLSLNLSILLIFHIHFCKQLLIFPKTGNILCSLIYYVIKKQKICGLSNKITSVAVILDTHFSFSVQVSLPKSRVCINFFHRKLYNSTIYIIWVIESAVK